MCSAFRNVFLIRKKKNLTRCSVKKNVNADWICDSIEELLIIFVFVIVIVWSC